VPIDVAALLRDAADPRAGAIECFVGVVRSERDARNQPLEALEYTAYEPMALDEMRRLCADAAGRWTILRAALVHRLGVLRIGDASVVVVVSTGHRAEAFDACRFLIEELKHRVPIFKKELWRDGHTSWVEDG
jgi:molybdopterin synthase catalytic subunit